MATGHSAPETLIREAEVAGKIGGYFGVVGSDPRITTLLSKVYPEIQLAASGDPGSWQSAFVGVMAKYEGYAKELGLGVSQAQRDIELLRNSNRTDANFAGAVGRLGWQGLQHYAAIHRSAGDGDSRGGGGSSGAERSVAAVLGRDAPLSATGAVGFTRELGVPPGHAGFFVGASSEMRDALRNSIHHGTAITDNHVKNMNDVSAVMGAVRAGKLSSDDPRIPPSVKQIMKEMKEKGIDPATAKPEEIKKYLKDHPDALKAAKKANANDIRTQEGLTDEEKTKQMKAAADTTPSNPASVQKPHHQKTKGHKTPSAEGQPKGAPTKTNRSLGLT